MISAVILILIGTLHGEELYTSPRHYVLNLTQTDWHVARDTCVRDDGRLATVYDLSTIPDLNLSSALSGTNGLVWIGLVLRKTTWDWDFDEDKVTWFNWIPDQMTSDDVTGSQCVAASVDRPYYWHVISCDNELPHLCQFKQAGSCRFEPYPNMTITAHNYVYLYQKTATQCMQVCTQEVGYTCQSFDFRPNDGRCQFNSGNRWTLHQYYTFTSGWMYYHRTCNSANVVGELNLIPSTTLVSSYVKSSSYIHTSTPYIESSFENRPTCYETKEVLLTQYQTLTLDITITRDVTSTHDLTQTNYLTFTRDVMVSRDIFATRDVYATYNVTETQTVWQTSNTTIVTTSTHVITWTPVFANFSISNETDPVQELEEITEQAKERQKILKKVSAKDKRPSAKYMGYVAIIFLTCVIGSLVFFDMLTICQKCSERKKKRKRSERSRRDVNIEDQPTTPVTPTIDWAKLKTNCDKKQEEAVQKRSKEPMCSANVTDDQKTEVTLKRVRKLSDVPIVMIGGTKMTPESKVLVDHNGIVKPKGVNNTNIKDQNEETSDCLVTAAEIPEKKQRGKLHWRSKHWNMDGLETQNIADVVSEKRNDYI